MFNQFEKSETITMRNRINRQQVIQTDLELSETIGDSDSTGSFDARDTLREEYEDEEEFNPPLLSEKSLTSGNQILGPVSFLSNTSLAEGVGRRVELKDLEGHYSQKETQNRQSGQTNIPSFRPPAVYGKQSGKRIGGLETFDFSGNKLTVPMETSWAN